MLSKSVVRSPSWYNLIAAWFVYSLSYGLLVGRQEGPDQPPMGLCLAQTLLIYAVPALVTSATFNLYIEVSARLHPIGSVDRDFVARSDTSGAENQTRFLPLIIIEVVLQLIFPGGRFHLVGRAPTNFFCHLADNLPSTITGGVAATIGSIMLPLQVWLAVTIYRSSDALRRLAEADRQLFVTLYVRLTLTTLATFMGFGLSITAVFSMGSDKTGLAYPIVAIVMAIALGTQKVINLLIAKHHMVEGNLSVGHPPRLVILAPT
ncbi:hypothetical protein AGABI2DRAFT_121542 [Agaricus bisporus var. bisporus H97]|uniref:hypothetical protein n=1 Tax=Agaricus bisporus var. bisporus (strain H97 / ATCC MYA-4626 / FGSC 10389) TaxID=936046 RepID=UPI00029F6020|nr:hypothetical protein AGABI2DRAFT_121542 [Agaricus bisporus var. bisporus H97]EKV43417.1 hypothetical protein AGABI2DRAFT_121542 [Agaricus bisporus var. bisporus H97]